MSEPKLPRFKILEGNALGVRDTLDGNNIHLGSKLEAMEVATMLNLFHDKAVECKQVVDIQAHKILELTEQIKVSKKLYLKQEERIVEAEYKALTTIAKNLKSSDVIAEEHY